MKNQDGKTPLELILTIAILIIVAGIAIAMIFGGTDIASDIKGLIQNTNTVEDENVQDETVQTEE